MAGPLGLILGCPRREAQGSGCLAATPCAVTLMLRCRAALTSTSTPPWSASTRLAMASTLAALQGHRQCGCVQSPLMLLPLPMAPMHAPGSCAHGLRVSLVVASPLRLKSIRPPGPVARAMPHGCVRPKWSTATGAAMDTCLRAAPVQGCGHDVDGVRAAAGACLGHLRVCAFVHVCPPSLASLIRSLKRVQHPGARSLLRASCLPTSPPACLTSSSACVSLPHRMSPAPSRANASATARPMPREAPWRARPEGSTACVRVPLQERCCCVLLACGPSPWAEGQQPRTHRHHCQLASQQQGPGLLACGQAWRAGTRGHVLLLRSHTRSTPRAGPCASPVAGTFTGSVVGAGPAAWGKIGGWRPQHSGCTGRQASGLRTCRECHCAFAEEKAMAGREARTRPVADACSAPPQPWMQHGAHTTAAAAAQEGARGCTATLTRDACTGARRRAPRHARQGTGRRWLQTQAAGLPSPDQHS